MPNAPETGSGCSFQKHCILVVDDDATVRKLIARRLSGLGCGVIEAEGADEAFAILCREEASLVLTDWEMPGKDGLSLCRRIREHPELGFFYIIILTARCSQADLLQGLEAGADEYLRKPVDMDELSARIRVGLRFVEMQAKLEHRNAELCRTASELQRANRRMAMLASHDGLTGLLNRQEGIRRYTGLWTVSDPAVEPLSCVMIDIDHFKRINDTYGHDAGDQVLVAVSNIITQSCRSSDFVARLGGEEFLVVCPGTRIADASRIAERVRQAVASTTVATSSGQITPTCSLGVAQREASTPNPQALLKAADERLYEAKSRGRNRVVSGRQDGARDLAPQEIILID